MNTTAITLGEFITQHVAPSSLNMLFWELVAFSVSLTLFKKLDYELQQTTWYKTLAENKTVQGILVMRLVKLLLDLTHHWYMGVALILYSDTDIVQWIGAGLLVADLPDMKRRFDEMLAIMGETLNYPAREGDG